MYLKSILFGLLSFVLIQSNIYTVEIAEAQLSTLQDLELMTTKIDNVNPFKEEFVEVLNTEIVNRSTDSSQLANFINFYSHGYYLIVLPISEGWSYIDGARCHIGNYAEFSLITVFEGINQGSQLTVAYDGRVLFINPYFTAELLPHGIVYHHTYDNANIVTGSNQIMYVR
jgi:hypothetical protein